MKRGFTFIFLLIFTMLTTSACSSSRELASNVSEQEAQNICVLLYHNGIYVDKEMVSGENAPRWRVTISAPVITGDELVMKAQSILKENNLPHPRKEINFPVSPIGTMTITEEQLRKQATLEESLERTFEQQSGVVSAEIHLALSDTSPLRDSSQQTQARASVILRYNSKTEPFSADEIRAITANSIEGLSPDRVSATLKQVSPPDPDRPSNIYYSIVKVVSLGSAIVVSILTILFIIAVMRMRAMKSRIAELERALRPRPVANSNQTNVNTASAG